MAVRMPSRTPLPASSSARCRWWCAASSRTAPPPRPMRGPWAWPWKSSSRPALRCWRCASWACASPTAGTSTAVWASSSLPSACRPGSSSISSTPPRLTWSLDQSTGEIPMSLTITLWSKVGVDVQSVLAAASTITGITKASPAVASEVGHTYQNGDLLLLRVSGMRQLDYRVVRVANKAVDSYELEGVDSTSFDTFISGTAQKITFGISCATLQDVNASGGDAEAILIKTVHDEIGRAHV